MSGFTTLQMTEGWLLLRELLPQARADMVKYQNHSQSRLADAMTPYLREDNFEAVIIYQDQNGGWIADLLLKQVPPGVSNALGTPVGFPHSTREEAVQSAIHMISSALLMGQTPAANTEPVFFYYDSEISLIPHLLAKLEEMGGRYATREDALKRLEQITLTLFPAGFDFERLQQISKDRDRMASLVSVIHMSVMHGIMRYPERIPGQPGAKMDFADKTGSR